MTPDNRLNIIKAYHSLQDNKSLVLYMGDSEVIELLVYNEPDATLADADKTITVINEALDILLYTKILHYIVLPLGTKYTIIDDKIVPLTTKIHTVG